MDIDPNDRNVRKQRRFPFLFFLIVASLFILGIVGIFSYSNANAILEDTANAYFKAVKGREFTKAYYAYTSKNFQKNTSLEAFKKGIKGYTLFEGAGSIQFNTRHADPANGNGFLQGIVKSVQGTQAPISLWFVKEDRDWKLDRMESFESVDSVIKQKLLDALKVPVLANIHAIRNADIETAYQGTSEEFKKVTDLERFKQFLSTNPLIANSTNEEFLEAYSTGNLASLELSLYNKEGSIKIVYELIQTQGKWSIISAHVVKDLAEISMREEEFIGQYKLNEERKVIDIFIAKIKEGNLEEAYNAVMSKEFKKETPFQEFKQFVDESPFLLNDKGMQFVEGSVQGTSATLEIDFTSDDNESEVLEFELVKENDEWKIIGIKVMDTSI